MSWVKVWVPQGQFKPNGSRFWCPKACLSQTGQGFGASRPVSRSVFCTSRKLSVRPGGLLYVLRAFCTSKRSSSTSKRPSVRLGGAPGLVKHQKLGTNSLKFQLAPKWAGAAPAAGFLSLSQTGQSFALFKPNGTEVSKKCPGRRGVGGRKPLPPLWVF